MKTQSLFCFILLIFLTSCGIKKIEISEKILSNNNKNITFDMSNDQKKIFFIQDRTKYEIINSERLGINGNFFYSFFTETEKQFKQTLFVYNTETKKYEYFSYYPETSHFFEDDLVCIINEKNPNTFPLPQLYEIKTTVIDFKNNITKENIYKCRNWDPPYPKRIKDFYFQKPSFRKLQKFDTDYEYYDLPFKKYFNEGPIYSCVWQQAHYPSFIFYFCKESQKAFITNYFPQINNASEYRIPEQELIPCQNQISELSLLNCKKENLICSYKCEYGESAILFNGANRNNYNSYQLNIHNGNQKKEFNLSEIFEYQDELINIETASSKNNKACFIITTKEFSYDMFIDFITFEIDIYLRASSFPEEERYFE